MELLENKTGEITAWGYLFSIAESNSIQQIGVFAVFIVVSIVLGLI